MTDSDLHNRLSAKPCHVNDRSEQPYFVKNLSTTLSKFSPCKNLLVLFVPEMSIEMLFFTQSKTTNLGTYISGMGHAIKIDHGENLVLPVVI